MSKYIFRLLSSAFIFVLFLSLIPQELHAQYNDKRISGGGRYETAVEISKKGYPRGSGTVVLARGDLFPDALAGAPLAHQLKAPILLTNSDKLPNSTMLEITRLKAKKVILLGGPNAILDSVKVELEKKGLIVERIGGSDRYRTSVEIAKKLKTNSEDVIVTTGVDFPDALAIAPYAAENGIPILLTLPDKVPSSVETQLRKYKNTTVIGGTNAIQEKVKNQLPNPKRISGASRYHTALQIIDTFYEKNEHIYLSTGANFPDALTGSVLAAKENTAVLLVNPTKLTSGTDTLIGKKQVKTFNVFGGNPAVPDTVVREFVSLLSIFKEAIGSGEFSDDVKLLTVKQSEAFIKAGNNAEIQEDGSITLTIDKTIAKDFSKNQVIFTPPNELQPTGFIAQIISINKDTGYITIAQPALDEVLDYFDISGEGVLTTSNIIDFDLKEGVSLELEGQEITNIQDFNKVLSSNPGFLANSNNYFNGKPVTFNLNTTLLEEGANSIVLTGKYELLDAKTRVETSEGFFGGLKSFNYDFEANQKATVEVAFKWKNQVKPPARKGWGKDIGKKGVDWANIEGVDRSDRIPLASLTYQVGTAPFFGIGNHGYISIPIGVTVFISSSLSGELEASATIGVVENSTYKFGANWDNSSKDFNTNSDFLRHKYDLVIKGSAKGDVRTGFGLEGAVNIAGLLPAVIQNDVYIQNKVDGNGSLRVDLRGYNDPQFSGCIETSHKAGIQSVLKARLKAKLFNVETGFTYNKGIFSHDFFNKGIRLCEKSGLIQGSVTDAVTTERLADVQVVASKDGVFHKSTITNPDGSYELELMHGTYDLVFQKTNYENIVYRNVEVNKDEIFYSPELRLIGSNFRGNGEVSGYIKDSRNGAVVDGVTLNIRSGFNTLTGTIIKTIHTDNYGYYYINALPNGAYTVELVKEGYIPGSFDIVSIGGHHRENQNASISPIIPDDELVVVLSWNEVPKDLDAHFTGPTLYGDRFHIYFNSMDYYENGDLKAFLDTDDVDSFGPETITLREQIGGVYRYYVHDYTNRDDHTSTALSKSGAKVQVYRGNNLLRTFNVPTNKVGNVWSVFELTGNTLQPINELGNPNEFQRTDTTINERKQEVKMIIELQVEKDG